MDTTQSIAEAGAKLAVQVGFNRLTVAAVAREAGVSSALVHYHFDTKQALIVAAASRLSDGRVGRVRGALAAGEGLATLDAVWSSLALAVSGGDARAWVELVAQSSLDRAIAAVLVSAAAAEQSAVAARLPGLLRELGAAVPSDVEAVAAAVLVCCDGAAQALLAGADARLVRSAYDAFWLALVDARPRGARR